MSKTYNYGLGISTTSESEKTGDQLAAENCYGIPSAVYFGYRTWENKPVSDEVQDYIWYRELEPQRSEDIYVTITTPTSQPSASTTQSSIQIGGVAIEPCHKNFSLQYTLTYSATGASSVSGSPSGDENWYVDIPLNIGANDFEIIMTNSESVTASDSISITRSYQQGFRSDDFSGGYPLDSYWTEDLNAGATIDVQSERLELKGNSSLSCGGTFDPTWVYQSPGGVNDFDVSSKVEVQFAGSGEAGMIAQIDDSNYVRIYFKSSPCGADFEVIHCINGNSYSVTDAFTETVGYFRIKRESGSFKTYYSYGGTSWTEYTPSTSLSDSSTDIKIGLYVGNDTETVYFDDFDCSVGCYGG